MDYDVVCRLFTIALQRQFVETWKLQTVLVRTLEEERAATKKASYLYHLREYIYYCTQNVTGNSNVKGPSGGVRSLLLDSGKKC